MVRGFFFFSLGSVPRPLPNGFSSAALHLLPILRRALGTSTQCAASASNGDALRGVKPGAQSGIFVASIAGLGCRM